MNKPICKRCGDDIVDSFGFNAEDSEFCQGCYSEGEECKDCGDRDFLGNNGRCYMCNETII